MLEIDRFEKILAELEKEERLSYQQLEKMFSVSSSTIRRDVKKMQSKGLLVEIKGGVSSIKKMKYDVEVDDRFKENTVEKKEIAINAIKTIKNGDFIYLDAGTTVHCIIEKLKSKNITVVTNGFMHIEVLAKYKIKTIIVGGEVKSSTKAIVGAEAIETLQKYRFDKCFLGANGVSLENGYTTPELSEAMVKRKVLELSEEKYVLIDSTKFNKTSNIQFGKIEDCKIITSNKAMKTNEKYKKYLVK